MTSVSATARSGRRPLAIVLAILGVLAIILGILFLSGALNSVHVLVGKVHKGSHDVRASIALVVGVVLIASGWLTRRAS